MKELGAEKHNPFEDYFPKSNSIRISESNKTDLEAIFSKQKEVYDIDLGKIHTYILLSNKQKVKPKFKYNDIFIGSKVNVKIRSIWNTESNNTNKLERTIRNSIVLRNSLKTNSDSLEVRNYFDSKFEELIDENKYKEADSILDSYFKLYELKLKNKI